MRDSGNIFAWLGRAEEYEVMADAERHVELTCKTVAHLADAVQAFLSGDLGAKTLAIEKVRDGEREADVVRLRMIRKLSEGIVLPADREDLVRFAESLDKIADGANRTARLLGLIDQPLPAGVLKNIAIGVDLIVKSVEELHASIQAMCKSDIKTALTHVEAVHRLEHEADDQKRVLLDAVLHANLDAATLLVTYNLTEAVEAVTDRVETVADLVNTLAARVK